MLYFDAKGSLLSKVIKGIRIQIKITIIIIAHRLTSIKSAQNLLLIEKTDTITLSKKGSVEYYKSLDKLRNYTQPVGEGENEEEEL